MQLVSALKGVELPRRSLPADLVDVLCSASVHSVELLQVHAIVEVSDEPAVVELRGRVHPFVRPDACAGQNFSDVVVALRGLLLAFMSGQVTRYEAERGILHLEFCQQPALVCGRRQTPLGAHNRRPRQFRTRGVARSTY